MPAIAMDRCSECNQLYLKHLVIKRVCYLCERRRMADRNNKLTEECELLRDRVVVLEEMLREARSVNGWLGIGGK